MKLHSVVRIGLVSLMLVGTFIAGQHYSRTAAAQSPQKWEYQIVGCGVGCSRSSFALPQELRVIRVGVPVMKNNASRSVPDLHARGRLVKAFNDEKPDKKLHVRVQGVPLDGTNPDEIASQGAAKNCDYVVYTTLIELRTQGDPVERRPGTIEINPGAKRGAQDPESEAMNPEYQATVEYKLYRTGTPSAISSAPFSTEKAMSEMNAVSQVIDRIANSVFADVKKDITARP